MVNKGILILELLLIPVLGLSSCGGPTPLYFRGEPFPVLTISASVAGELQDGPVTVYADIGVALIQEGTLKINWGDTDEWVPIPATSTRLSRQYHSRGNFIISVEGQTFTGKLLQDSARITIE